MLYYGESNNIIILLFITHNILENVFGNRCDVIKRFPPGKQQLPNPSERTRKCFYHIIFRSYLYYCNLLYNTCQVTNNIIFKGQKQILRECDVTIPPSLFQGNFFYCCSIDWALISETFEVGWINALAEAY